MKRKRDYPHRASDLAPAPGDLRIVQALVNTRDLERGTDELATPRALADWLARRGLLPAGTELGATDVGRVIEVREALRAMLLANNGGRQAEKAVADLDRVASEAPVVVRFGAGFETRFEAGDRGLGGALGRLFAIVASARLEGSWPRFKACADGDCRAAFYDGSPNRSGKWCSMRRCGNRRNSRVSKVRRRRYKAALRQQLKG